MHFLQLRQPDPPQRGERGGHVCVEKRRHLCYKYARLPRFLKCATTRLSLRYVSAVAVYPPPYPLLPELLASSKILKIVKARRYGGKAVKEDDLG